MEQYKIYATHDEGYNAGFNELYVTKEGLKDFVKKFKASNKECDETVDTQYIEYYEDRIEWQGFTIHLELFEEPEFLNMIPSFEVHACESGHQATNLYMKEIQ